jgi:hypothetical protein
VERFKLWDDDADGVVDLLELLSALIFLSSSSFSSKLRALFDLFHFSDSPGGLSAEEMSNLVQRWSKAAERVLGTERMKERYEAEMDEVAKRAMVHLTFDLPSAISRPAHHLHPSINLLTGKPQVEVSFKRFEIFCGVTPMLLQAFTRHGTTDGEETKTYWTGVLGQPGTQVYLDARNRYGVSSVALANFKELREEAQRIHASFRHWIPLHRHLLNYRANHAQAHGGGAGGGAEEKLQGGKGGAGMSVLVTSPSSAMSPTRASAAGASPVSSPNRRPASSGLSTPSSPMLGGAVNAAASSSSSSSAAASSSASSSLPLLPPPSHLPTPSLAHLDEMLPISPAQVALGDVQSKWKDNTASSKARGVKKKHVSSHTQTAKDKLAAHLALLEAKHAAQHAAGGMMGGHGGGGPGGMMQMNPHAAAVAKKVAEATKLDDGRNRPAYLAIRRIKAKVQSRRDKSDPAFQHFVYDHQTLRQAKHLFDQIDTDQSGQSRMRHCRASASRTIAHSRSLWFLSPRSRR